MSVSASEREAMLLPLRLVGNRNFAAGRDSLGPSRRRRGTLRAMARPDPVRWKVLSPLLDELLDAEPGERQARLEGLRREDPQLAGELEVFLAHGAAAGRASSSSPASPCRSRRASKAGRSATTP